MPYLVLLQAYLGFQYFPMMYNFQMYDMILRISVVRNVPTALTKCLAITTSLEENLTIWILPRLPKAMHSLMVAAAVPSNKLKGVE